MVIWDPCGRCRLAACAVGCAVDEFSCVARSTLIWTQTTFVRCWSKIAYATYFEVFCIAESQMLVPVRAIIEAQEVLTFDLEEPAYLIEGVKIRPLLALGSLTLPKADHVDRLLSTRTPAWAWLKVTFGLTPTRPRSNVALAKSLMDMAPSKHQQRSTETFFWCFANKTNSSNRIAQSEYCTEYTASWAHAKKCQNLISLPAGIIIILLLNISNAA